MNFEELNTAIPHVIGKKLHVLSMHPYDGVTLKMPGRHQKDTKLAGGDYVVIVTDTSAGWKSHRFKHDDIFIDFEKKRAQSPGATEELMTCYFAIVVRGEDPLSYTGLFDTGTLGGNPAVGVNIDILLPALQCLAVAEHRRYPQHEARGGGRHLPLRFTAGIVEGKWTAADAVSMQKRGRPGVEILESKNGMPDFTQTLLDTIKSGGVA